MANKDDAYKKAMNAKNSVKKDSSDSNPKNTNSKSSKKPSNKQNSFQKAQNAKDKYDDIQDKGLEEYISDKADEGVKNYAKAKTGGLIGGSSGKDDKDNKDSDNSKDNKDKKQEKKPKKDEADDKKNLAKKAMKKKALKTGARAGGIGGAYVGAKALFKMTLEKIKAFFMAIQMALQNLVSGSILASIGGFLSSIGSAIAGAVSAIFSTTAGTIAAIGVLSTLGVGGTILGTTIALNNGVREGILPDCKEEVSKVGRAYGQGEIKIPETIDGMRVGYATTWECDLGWAKRNIGQGTNQRKIVEMWDGSDGTAADENGFGRINDYYLVAIRVNAYGQTPDKEAQIGDHITFYLSDGTGIECIVFDAKGPTSGPGFDYMNGTPKEESHSMEGHGTFNGWGHISFRNPPEVNILEFAGEVSENNHFEKITGKKNLRVTSATNHGPAPEWIEKVGESNSGVEGATKTKNKSRAKNMGKKRDVCRSSRVGFYDNSDIARAAASFAMPTSTTTDGTDLYQRVHDNVGSHTGYRDCGGAVVSAVLWSGSDDDFPKGHTGTMLAYCLSSDRWEKVGEWGGSNSLEEEDLAPGDVFIVDDRNGAFSTGHTFLYTGNEIAKEIHGDDLDPSNANCMSASLDERGPGMDRSVDWHRNDERGAYSVFRCVDPMNSDKFKNAHEK